MFPRQTEFLWTRVRRRLARVMLASRSCVSTGPPQKLSPLENSELKTKSPVSKLFNAIKPDYIKLYLETSLLDWNFFGWLIALT